MSGILGSIKDPFVAEEHTDIAVVKEAPLTLLKLALLPRLSAASPADPPSHEQVKVLQECLCDSTRSQRETMRALDELKAYLPWCAFFREEDLTQIGLGVLSLLGSRTQLTHTPLPVLCAALDTLSVFAGLDVAARALLDEGVIQLLLGWIFADESGATLRCRVLDTLVAFLHAPKATGHFTNDVELLPCHEEATRTNSAHSNVANTGYRRLLALALEPVVPMMHTRLKHVFALVKARDVGSRMLEVSTEALHTEGVGAEECDALGARLIEVLCDFQLALNTLMRIEGGIHSNSVPMDTGAGRNQGVASVDFSGGTARTSCRCVAGGARYLVGTVFARQHPDASTRRIPGRFDPTLVESVEGALTASIEPVVLAQILSLLKQKG